MKVKRAADLKVGDLIVPDGRKLIVSSVRTEGREVVVEVIPDPCEESDAATS